MAEQDRERPAKSITDLAEREGATDATSAGCCRSPASRPSEEVARHNQYQVQAERAVLLVRQPGVRSVAVQALEHAVNEVLAFLFPSAPLTKFLDQERRLQVGQKLPARMACWR